ncbi:MAG: hypothetical protein KGZ59_08415 [Chitinophagaceae bacterium]|nr:hypothetical protein [Chitinophagaceae bacterium]
MEDKNLSATESLHLIEGMINKAKDRFAENGLLYLLWGWVVLACSITQYILIMYSNFSKPEMVWAITWLVVIFQIFYLSKQEKNRKVKTYTDELIGFVWMVFGISMFIVGFILGKNNQWTSMYPIIIGLYGMPTFLSGAIMKFKPLKVGAICCWIFAILSTFIPLQYSLLLIGAAVIVAWIIPGYLLRQKFIQENK